MNYSDDFFKQLGKVSDEYIESVAKHLNSYGDDFVEIFTTFGDEAVESVTKYSDDAITAMKNGIEPKLISSLDELGVSPSQFTGYGITTKEAAEVVESAINTHGSDIVVEVIAKSSDDAITAMKNGIEPTLIKNLDDLGVSPAKFADYGIASKEAAEAADSVIRNYGDEALTSIKNGIDPQSAEKIYNWIERPSDELYLEYKSVFDNSKYYNQSTGDIIWPENDGFVATPSDMILEPGTKIDRYGTDAGRFTSPEGISYSSRSLAPGTNLKPYSVFEVLEPISVKAGEIAPWFDEIGGGIQYVLPESVEDLLNAGIIRRVE